MGDLHSLVRDMNHVKCTVIKIEWRLGISVAVS